MWKWLLLILSVGSVSAQIIYRDRLGEMQRSMREFGETMHQIGKEESERKRQARLDSMRRATDSIENEMRRMELEMKRIRLEEMKRRAREDSLYERRRKIEYLKDQAGYSGWSDAEVNEHLMEKYPVLREKVEQARQDSLRMHRACVEEEEQTPECLSFLRGR